MASSKATGPTVGLDIGTAFIKAVEMRPARGKPNVAAIGIAPTPPNVFSGDVISDPITLGTAIKKLLQESGISSKKVVASVTGSTNFVMRILPVPTMTDKELIESMRWEVERHVPFRPEDTIKDFVRLPSANGNGDAAEMSVLLVVGQKQLIDSITNTLLFAGLTPVALDVEPLSALRTVPLHDVRENCIAIVNMGATKTDVGIFDKGVLVYPRSIPVAGANMTRAVADTLGLPTEQAERLKVEHGEIPEDRTPATSIFDEPGGGFGAFDLPDDFGAPVDLGGTALGAPDVADDALDFGTPAPPTAPAEPEEPFGGGFAAPADEDTSTGGISFSMDDEETAPAPTGFSFALDDEDTAPAAPTAPEPSSASAFAFEDEEPPASPAATPEPTTSFAFDDEPAAAPAAGASAFDDAFDSGDAFGSTEPAASDAVAPISGAPVPVTEEDRRRRQVADALVPVFNDLSLEIRRTMDVYANRPDGHAVQHVYLCGGTARTRGLARALEQDLGIPVHLEDPSRTFPLTGRNVQPGYYAEVGPVVALAIGLGIRDQVPDPTPTPVAAATARKKKA